MVAGLSQKINEHNAFATNMMSVCVDAAKSAENALVLNDSTDGVSWTVKTILISSTSICQYIQSSYHSLMQTVM